MIILKVLGMCDHNLSQKIITGQYYSVYQPNNPSTSLTTQTLAHLRIEPYTPLITRQHMTSCCHFSTIAKLEDIFGGSFLI